MQKNKNVQTRHSTSQRAPRWALYFLILSSGAAGLIYEVVFAFALSYSELARPHEPGHLVAGVSFAVVLIILFPLFSDLWQCYKKQVPQ